MISCNAVVSDSSEDCEANLNEKECENTFHWWFTEPQQIESSNDLMLLYNESLASFNSSNLYVPPSEYTALGLFTNDCVSSEGDTDAGLSVLLWGDLWKDEVTDAGKTYSVASAKSEFMEDLRSSNCEFDFSRMANNDKSVGQAKLDAETRVAVSNTIQSKAQIEYTRALMSTLRWTHVYQTSRVIHVRISF